MLFSHCHPQTLTGHCAQTKETARCVLSLQLPEEERLAGVMKGLGRRQPDCNLLFSSYHLVISSLALLVIHSFLFIHTFSIFMHCFGPGIPWQAACQHEELASVVLMLVQTFWQLQQTALTGPCVSALSLLVTDIYCSSI